MERIKDRKFSVVEAAELLRVTVGHLRRIVEVGDIESSRGRNAGIVLFRSDLRLFLLREQSIRRLIASRASRYKKSSVLRNAARLAVVDEIVKLMEIEMPKIGRKRKVTIAERRRGLNKLSDDFVALREAREKLKDAMGEE